MDAKTLQELKDLIANATQQPWQPYRIDLPISEIPAYVEKCISQSPSQDFYIIVGKNNNGEEKDVCHIGNGPNGANNAAAICALFRHAPALIAAAEAMQWRPIETAPKGKPGFLALDNDETSIEWLIDWGGDSFLSQNSSNYTNKKHWKSWKPLGLPGDAA